MEPVALLTWLQQAGGGTAAEVQYSVLIEELAHCRQVAALQRPVEDRCYRHVAALLQRYIVVHRCHLERRVVASQRYIAVCLYYLLSAEDGCCRQVSALYSDQVQYNGTTVQT